MQWLIWKKTTPRIAVNRKIVPLLPISGYSQEWLIFQASATLQRGRAEMLGLWGKLGKGNIPKVEGREQVWNSRCVKVQENGFAPLLTSCSTINLILPISKLLLIFTGACNISFYSFNTLLAEDKPIMKILRLNSGLCHFHPQKNYLNPLSL